MFFSLHLDILESPNLNQFQADLRKKMSKFVDYIPVSAIIEFGAYKNKRGTFKDMLEEERGEYTPARFWEVAHVDFSKIAAIGQNLLKVPAIFPKVKMQNFYKFFSNKSVNEVDFINYKISVLLNNPEANLENDEF